MGTFILTVCRQNGRRCCRRALRGPHLVLVTTLQKSTEHQFLSKRIKTRYSKKYLFTNVHSSTIHNSQEMETSPNTHEQMDG